MLLGCGCHCGQPEESQSALSQSSVASTSIQYPSWSESFPSTSNFPNSTDYSGGYGYPCQACAGDVIADAYRVSLPLTEQPPSGYSIECWSQIANRRPFLVQRGAFSSDCISLQSYGLGLPVGAQTCCFSNAFRGAAAKIGCHIFEGDGVCGLEPSVRLMFVSGLDDNDQPIYLVFVEFSFFNCGDDALGPVTNALNVLYRGSINDAGNVDSQNKIACLNEIKLKWFTALGTFRSGAWGFGGYAPGQNFSFQNYRGSFPEFITFRPNGT